MPLTKKYNKKNRKDFQPRDLSNIKDGGQRSRYDTFLTKGWCNGVNKRCLLRTTPQDQHTEYGATHRERLLDILKQPPATPEG